MKQFNVRIFKKNSKVVATEELTAKQKKLPAGLQKAIAKKSGDKEPEVEEKTEEVKSDKKEKAVDKVQEKYTYIKKLIEQEVEKAEIVIAAKSIVDELQTIVPLPIFTPLSITNA